MTVHVGELTSQVQMTGVPAASGQQAADAGRPPGWAERQRFDELADDRARDRARTAEEGFDG